MNELFAMLWVSMALFVLYETSAVYEYMRFLKIPNFISKMKDYTKELEFNKMSYGEYYRIFHDSFFVRWLTCPYCFGMALSIGFTLLFSNWQAIPITYLGGLLSYRTFTRADKWLYGGSDE
jgi:hypothetical protein